MESHSGYRYPGSRPFEDNDVDRCLFFGREKDKEALFQKVRAKRLVVLYAKSGLGKTSLVNAGLNQLLRENGCVPLKVRFNNANIKPEQAVLDWIQRTVEYHHLDYEPGETQTLWQYFKTAAFWSPGNDLLTPVLILDQFEEFFTFHSPDRRQEFISQLADVVNGTVPSELRKDLKPGKWFPYGDEIPNIKILISIREDFLGQLDELSEEIPDIFHNRFRLQALTRDQAREAIIQPSQIEDSRLQTLRFCFSKETVEIMLDFLCTRKERYGIVRKDEVEAFQLQLLCQYIEDGVRRKAQDGIKNIIVEKEELGGEQGMQKVLQNFYQNCITQLSAAWRKKYVRRLCEKGLISVTDRRLSLEEEEIERKFKVPPYLLTELVNIRLLRAESRVGSVYYELSHDTLVAPILKAQRKRRTTALWISSFIIIPFLIIIAFLLMKPEKIPETPDNIINRRNTLYEEAGEQIRKKNYEKAIEKYNAILKLDQKYVKAYLEIGQLLKKMGKYSAAEDKYKEAIDKGIEDSAIYFELGQTRMAMGKTKHAILDYNKAIEINPKNSDAYESLGQAFETLNNFEYAVQNFERALKCNDSRHETYSKLAILHLKRSEPDKAIEVFERSLKSKAEYTAIYKEISEVLKEQKNMDWLKKLLEIASKIDSKNELHFFYLGQDYIELKEYDEAIKSFEKALEIKPNDVEVLYNKGVLLHKLEKYDEAIESFKKALEIKLDDSEIWYNMGVVLQKQQKYDEAIESFKKVLEIKPGNAEVWCDIGYALHKQQKYDMAIESFKKALEIKPNDSWIWYNLGIVFNKQQKYDEAIESFEKALEIKPDDAEVWYNMGIALYKLKKYDKAIKACMKTLEIEPDYGLAHYIIGLVLREKKKHIEAIEAFRKALRANLDDAEAYYNMGVAFFEYQKYDLAIKSFKKSINIKPDSAKAYYYIGFSFYLFGNYRQAIENYKKAQKIDPNDVDIYFNMGNAFYKQKEYDKAIENYKKALEVNPKLTKIYINIGIVLYVQKKYDSAIEYFKKALVQEPKSIMPKVFLANAYFFTQQMNDAYYFAKEILEEQKVQNISIKDTLSMRFVVITVLTFQGNESESLIELNAFIKHYRSFTEDYGRIWNYSRAKDFIKENKELREIYRDILLKLIDILESPKSEGDKKLTELEAVIPKER